MKEVYFLTSLPRSGNTLLGSIINQNPNLNLTANTILTDIIYQIYLLKLIIQICVQKSCFQILKMNRLFAIFPH